MPKEQAPPSAGLALSGYLYSFVTDERLYQRIAPPLTWNQVHDGIRRYYGKCIDLNPDSKWADSRLSALLDLRNWLDATWGEMDPAEQQTWSQWLRHVAMPHIEDSQFLSNYFRTVLAKIGLNS